MGVLKWTGDEQQGIASPVTEAHVYFDKTSGLLKLAFFQDPKSTGENAPLIRLQKHLESSRGLKGSFSTLKKNDALLLEVNGFGNEKDKLSLIQLVDDFKKGLKRVSVAYRNKTGDGKLEILIKNFTLEDLVKLENAIKSKGYEPERRSNREKMAFLQLSLDLKENGLDSRIDSELSAEQFVKELMTESEMVNGKLIEAQRDPNPVKQKINEIQDWRKANPVQSTGWLYLVGNLGQMASGVIRGNMGEAVMGVFYALSNLDLALGARPARTEKQIIADALEDFRTKDGKIDLDKSGGFTHGTRKFGTLIADYLNWRERPGNDVNSKAILAMMAGYSAFQGSLKGKKTLVLDEEGNVKLNSQGLPEYKYVKDVALLYDGAAAMAAYFPQLVFRSPRVGASPLVDISPVVVPVAKSTPLTASYQVVKDNPAVKWLADTYNYVEADPTNTTGAIMKTRNQLHIAIAGYDGLIGLPKKHSAYKLKLVTDSIRVLTPEGLERSHYNEMKEAFGIDKFVDHEGKVTNEARAVVKSTVSEFEARQAEKAQLKSKSDKAKSPEEKAAIANKVTQIDEYLNANGRKYELALTIGSFDKDDKPKSTGIPFINRKTEPASYQKLIKRHEDKLKNPYKEIEKGGSEEFLYKMALNRQFYEETGKSLGQPWLRMFYSVFNLMAADELKKVNSAVKPPPNEAKNQINTKALFDEAAQKIEEVINSTYGADDVAKNEAKERAIRNLARELVGEREIRGSRLVDVSDLADGIKGAMDGAPTKRHEDALRILATGTNQHLQPA